MRLAVVAAAAVACALLGACASGSDEGPRPAGVPDGAVLVKSERTLGVPSDGAGDPSEVRNFFHMGCSDGVLVIVTSREEVYAELPCARALPREIVEQYLGKAVKLRIVPGQPAKLFLQSDSAGSVEFTPGRVWLKRPG